SQKSPRNHYAVESLISNPEESEVAQDAADRGTAEDQQRVLHVSSQLAATYHRALMENDESRRPNDERIPNAQCPNDENSHILGLRNSGFVILSAFDISHLTFLIKMSVRFRCISRQLPRFDTLSCRKITQASKLS